MACIAWNLRRVYQNGVHTWYLLSIPQLLFIVNPLLLGGPFSPALSDPSPLPPPLSLSLSLCLPASLSPLSSLLSPPPGMTPVASKLTEFSLAKKTDNQNPLINGMHIFFPTHGYPNTDNSPVKCGFNGLQYHSVVCNIILLLCNIILVRIQLKFSWHSCLANCGWSWLVCQGLSLFYHLSV